MLLSDGLLDVPVLYLSRYIIENRPAYYQGLLGITAEQRREDWVLYMLSPVESTAHLTAERIRSILDLKEAARAKAESVLPKVQVPAILDVVFRHPTARCASSRRPGWARDRPAPSSCAHPPKPACCGSSQCGATTTSSTMPSWACLPDEDPHVKAADMRNVSCEVFGLFFS